MKKFYIYFLFISLFLIQSCSIKSEITYFKDKTSTSIMDVHAKEMFGMLKAFATDSTGKEMSLQELEKLPKNWTSLYDISQKEGKTPTNPDSIKIMKKSFMKAIYEDNELSGMSLKLEKFTKEEYKNFDHINDNGKSKLPLEKNIFGDWDGKTLIINTKDLDFSGINDSLTDKKEEAKILSSDEMKKSKEQMKAMMKMFDVKMVTTMKFENKIKSITDTSDHIRKIDDKTLEINLDFNKLMDESGSTKQKSDEKIIITTE